MDPIIKWNLHVEKYFAVTEALFKKKYIANVMNMKI